MLSKRLVLLTYCLGTAAALPALAADNTPLNVKPGLWEMTSDSEHSGTPPIPPEALATLTPEQRAKLEAAMQQSMGPQHRVMKHCVTQADIDKGFGEIEQMGHGKCTQKVASSTSTLRAGTFSCTGAETMSGTYRFEAPSPEAMVAHWDMTMSNGDKSMQMKSVTQGKWLGADCGDLKPKD
jgi:hypothetical protein